MIWPYWLQIAVWLTTAVAMIVLSRRNTGIGVGLLIVIVAVLIHVALELCVVFS